MGEITHISGLVALALALAAGAYALLAAALIRRFFSKSTPEIGTFPGVTILKPVQGVQPGMRGALESFLRQDYPGPVQIIFGIHGENDPAQPLLERLRQEFSGVDITIVANEARWGSNGKISNVLNMMSAAKFDILVLADSDIKVSSDYLVKVISSLSDPGIGLASCLYTGIGTGTFWSKLAGMGISYHFLPNVLVGLGAGLATPCFGSTIALTRQTLNSIGGFQAVANHLADDYEIGRLVRSKGLKVAFPQIIVEHLCAEADLDDLMRHELRWARTIRNIDLSGYVGLVATHSLPLALIGLILAGATPVNIGILGVVLAARFALKAQVDASTRTKTGPYWLLPLRDMLSFGIFVIALFGSAVAWDGTYFRVDKAGIMQEMLGN